MRKGFIEELLEVVGLVCTLIFIPASTFDQYNFYEENI